MVDLLYALAYIALPIVTYLVARNLTWTVAIVSGSVALVGAVVTFVIKVGDSWNFASLQLATLGALILALAVTLAARLMARERMPWPALPWRRHLLVVGLPFLVIVLIIVVSRLIAAPRAGLFTAVGYLVRRQYAEDNAKWLDFTGQLVTGNDVVQGVSMGGPLQLFLVIVATALATASVLLLGGVNEVFVAANTVVYAQYFLAAMVPFVFAPLVEARVKGAGDGQRRGFIPAPLLWAGMLVLAVAILAVGGLGHLTLQFVFLATVMWVGVFVIGSRVPHVYALTSLVIVVVSLVWFPLLPISVVVMVAGAVAIVVALVRGGARRPGLWAIGIAWAATIVLTWPEYRSTIGYMTADVNATGDMAGGAVGGIAAAAMPVPSLIVPMLDLLDSKGGTEAVGPMLGILLLISAVLATMFIARRRSAAGRNRLLLAFAPALLLGGYAVALAVLGTWYAGDGPNYGAVKTTFLVSVTIIAVAVPLALMEIDRRRVGTTLVRVAGIAGIVYLLAVDGILPRAAVYTSPEQWPDASGEDRGYWWPAEVRKQAEQTIESLPIACAYRPPGAGAPSALPNGQTAYSCTRLLVGLSGADTTGQPLVDWQRREWFTNTPAWDDEYPRLITLPESLRQKDFILMDELDEVVGLDSVQSFMDRYKPEWAQEQASG
ncbi:MAG TPA: hypothetical protein DCQ36_01295 [Actinobacteria bacterium]|nr:hypothetical protein [Actinomycetota bacterium]